MWRFHAFRLEHSYPAIVNLLARLICLCLKQFRIKLPGGESEGGGEGYPGQIGKQKKAG